MDLKGILSESYSNINSGTASSGKSEQIGNNESGIEGFTNKNHHKGESDLLLQLDESSSVSSLQRLHDGIDRIKPNPMSILSNEDPTIDSNLSSNEFSTPTSISTTPTITTTTTTTTNNNNNSSQKIQKIQKIQKPKKNLENKVFNGLNKSDSHKSGGTTTKVTVSKKKATPKIACVRCRRRHLSCTKEEILSDGSPGSCIHCVKAGVACEYVLPEKKLNISMTYLQKLHDDITALKKENMQLKSELTNAHVSMDMETKTTEGLSITKNKPHGDHASNSHDNNNNKNKNIQKGNGHKHQYSNHGGHEIAPKHHLEDHRKMDETSHLLDDSEEKVSNFADRRGRLVGSRTGQKYFVGSSSMTLFGMEIQSLVEKSKNKTFNKKITKNGESSTDPEYANTSHLIHNTTLTNLEPGIDKVLEQEGNAYKVVLAESKSNSGVMSVNFTLPSFSYAMLLVDTFITYNDGCFYFFNEGLVKENLRKTYNGFNVYEDQTLQTIWFCKCLLVFSIGEMYVGNVNDVDGLKLNTTSRKACSRLPGSGFFEQASEIFGCLFSSSRIDNLTKEGAIEVLLLYAFYLQVADCTVASYFYFGQTLRACLILGWHVDAEKDLLSRFELEHRRRLWWTVYMFERMLSSKAGLPLSFMDNTISSEFPSDFDMSNPPENCEHYIFPEAEYITRSIKITQVNAQILNKLYDRQPDSNILPVLKNIVLQLLEWRTQLPPFLQVEFNKNPFTISRLCTNIYTEYFQGLNLAIRPLLYHFTSLLLKKRSEIDLKTTKPLYINLQNYSKTISSLLNCSLQAAINTVKSLWVMFEHNNIALFGYMDREYLFNASCTLVLFSATFGLHEQINPYMDHSLRIFTKMRNLGNNPAGLRRRQLLKLMHDLDVYGFMKGLFDKHYDTLKIDKNFEDHYGPEIKIISVPLTTERKPESSNVSSPQINLMNQDFIPSNHMVGLSATLSSMRSTASTTNNINTPGSDAHSISTESSENVMEKNVDRLMTNNIEDTNEVEMVFQNLDDWSMQDNQLWKDITDQAMWLGSN